MAMNTTTYGPSNGDATPHMGAHEDYHGNTMQGFMQY